MYDFHLHSNHSMDSVTPMEDMVLAAIDKNIKSICFTDHVDLYFNSQKDDILFDKPNYFQNIEIVKNKYAEKIEILSGVEIGLQPSSIDKGNEFMEGTSYDFVIMSAHTVNDMELHEELYYKDINSLGALERYYNSIYTCIKEFNNYNVVGHLDYIDRYIPETHGMPSFNEYSLMVESVLELIIKNGKGIEINTSGLRYGLGTFHPKIEILKLYKELGGEIITIGSDAHNPQDIGHGYDTAINVLKELDFKHIYLFRNRLSSPIDIKK